MNQYARFFSVYLSTHTPSKAKPHHTNAQFSKEKLGEVSLTKVIYFVLYTLLK